VGPRASLDTVLKRKIPSSHQESNPDYPACSQLSYQLRYPSSHTNIEQQVNNSFVYKIKYSDLNCVEYSLNLNHSFVLIFRF
jgi:hypothetical protein